MQYRRLHNGVMQMAILLSVSECQSTD